MTSTHYRWNGMGKAAFWTLFFEQGFVNETFLFQSLGSAGRLVDKNRNKYLCI